MKVNKFIAVAAILTLFVACKSEKKPLKATDYIRPASMVYTAKDSADINSLVDSYVTSFNSKDYKSAADLLYRFENDSLKPLPEEEKQKFVKVMEFMSINECKLNSIVLRSDKNNEVQLTLHITKPGNNSAETRVYLNPVTKDGKWYLTLRDTNAPGVKDVYSNQ